MRGARLLARLWPRAPVERLRAPEAYARWAESYPAHPHNPVMAAESAIVAPLLRSVAARRALDVGTGTGRNAATLAAAGVPSIVGLDLSPDMLARNLSGAPLVRAEACRLPFASSRFDLVVSSLMCGDLPDVPGWIAEAARVLRPDGHLVYSDFHPSWHSAGWRRTFASDGHLYELPIHHHTIEDHLAGLEACGLIVRAIREPKAPGRSRPVVVVFHAVKPDATRGH